MVVSQSLAQQWAQRYLENLSVPQIKANGLRGDLDGSKKSVRAIAAERLLSSLSQVSLKAWSQTESLLKDEIERHQIDRRFVNPWEISQSAFQVYEKALELYTVHSSYSQVPFLMGPDIAKIRDRYTQSDPRVIGIVGMQFYYTSVLLKQQLSPIEKALLSNCFQVIDDHLYMPLHRAYDAAAKRPDNDPSLLAVRRLIDCSGEISERIVEQVVQLYPTYKTHSGALNDPNVRASSQRDTEMFQIYLFVSLLEDSFSIVQNELFPLCLMLYPRLKVRWELVRQMIQLFERESESCLEEPLFRIVKPHLEHLRNIFSSQYNTLLVDSEEYFFSRNLDG
jgi:hypothetical protein